MAASTTATSVSCPKCGAARPAEIAQTTPRPPCPECGAQGIAISIAVASEVNVATELRAAIRPSDQARGWERRWADINAELRRLLAPRTVTLSSDAVFAARRELLSFYVHAYHLKDALTLEAGAVGVSGSEVEAAVNADPDLALLVDLANLDKHLKLSKRPRSGAVPRIGQVQGSQTGSGQGGWRLEQVIEHRGRDLDGLAFAQAAVAAWERRLVKWALLPAP